MTDFTIKDVHDELCNIAYELGLQQPKPLEHYIEDVEAFELAELMAEEEVQMLSIDEFADNIGELEDDYEYNEESEGELVF